MAKVEMTETYDTHLMATEALREIGDVFDRTPVDTAVRMADEILAAGAIVCFGLGREGLMIRALCMRLMHLGLRASMVGDVTTPPVGPGDLAIIAAGPGKLDTAQTILNLAHQAGARALVVTAQPNGPVPQAADAVIHIPAQTMADDVGGPSLLPMGTAFEISMLILFDLVSIVLRNRTGQSMDDMRARHFNLE